MDNIVRILSFLFKKKAIWFGDTPPIIADCLSLDPYKNFRASSEKHGVYEVVWIYEYNLFSGPSWPLLFDEALCLLKQTGTLVVRIADNCEGTVIELKSYLFRRYDIDVQLLQQVKNKESDTVCVFNIQRKYYKEKISKNWTIGILTNGQKKENVVALIDKAASLISHERIEFLVAGKFDPQLTKTPEIVKLVGLKTNDELARISEKKYEIARHASHENIAIFHDRYVINASFFKGFELFGYDFNFITINQSYEDGTFFPGYAGLGESRLKWIVPRFDRNPGTFHTGHYINGGVMIFKKSLLGSLNFNPLLLHNEAEDVELSFILNQTGIIPRLNVFSSAVTVGIPNTYTGTFIEVSSTRPQLVTKRKEGVTATIWNKLPERVKAHLRFGRIYHWVRNNKLR